MAATKCGEGRTAEVMSITDILSKPLTVPPTTAEQQVASNVVRWMMSEHGDTIRLPTAGQVRYYNLNKEHIILLQQHSNRLLGIQNSIMLWMVLSYNSFELSLRFR